jgi:Fe-S-cluster containining protein
MSGFASDSPSAPRLAAAEETPPPAEKDVHFRGVNLSRDFRCLGCGACCRGPGTVWVSRQRAIEIAEYLGLPLSQFRARYCSHDWKGGHILRDRSLEDDACVFLTEDNRCAIHPVKPQQCVDFPVKWRNEDFETSCEGFKAARNKISDSESKRAEES